MKKIIITFATLPFSLLSLIARVYSKLLSFLIPSLKNYWLNSESVKNNSLIQNIIHPSISNPSLKFKIFIPNWICKLRADTFSTKEPETLSWIDSYNGQGALFDIGANIGLYSLYFAKMKKGNVYAFEPSVFNLPLLSKNIFINGLSKKIHIITNPLSQDSEFNSFNLSSTEEGGALSSFGVNYGHDGKAMKKVLSYKTLGLSLDYLVENKLIPEHPSLIKIDVDGIEHLILKGARKTLKNPKCSTILIEVNDKFKFQSKMVKKILTECNFKLEKKERSSIIITEKFSKTYNQIWTKKAKN